MITIPITEFKAKCLSLFRDVESQHEAIAIEKRGKIIAQIIPVSNSANGGYGCMKDTVMIKGDITAPIDAEWEANE
jgi:antitoxin (DNA-binding transcriptional repressor) of toxin-antitoxin stability system